MWEVREEEGRMSLGVGEGVGAVPLWEGALEVVDWGDEWVLT